MESTQAVFHQNRYAAELDRLIVVGCRWLDIGAGKRIHSGWIGPSTDDLAGRAALFSGCDLDPVVLQHPHIDDAKIADAADLPWPDESFDVVSANMVVEHLSDPVATFREVARVLRPGGAFVFVTPNRRYPVIRIARMTPPALRRLYAVAVEGRARADVFPTLYRCNTVEDIARVAEAAKLEPEMVQTFRNSATVLPGLLGAFERRYSKVGADIIAVLRRSA